MHIRSGTSADFDSIQRILDQTPQAAHWLPDGYGISNAELDATAAAQGVTNCVFMGTSVRSGMATGFWV